MRTPNLVSDEVAVTVPADPNFQEKHSLATLCVPEIKAVPTQRLHQAM
jgi:hypothetical protein